MKIGKIISALTCVLLTAVLLCIPAAAAKAKGAVSLDKTSVSVEEGKTVTLKAKVTGISKYTLIWSSDRKDICTVDQKGKITGVNVGSAVVSAKIKGKNISAKCKVTVTAASDKSTPDKVMPFNKTMTSKELVTAMQAGINIGNSLDAYNHWDYSGIYNGGLESETVWGNPAVNKKLIASIRKKGFKTVRIPVTWHNHMDNNFNIDANWMARVKEVVNYAIDNDMYVILNMHHDNEFYDIEEALASQSDYRQIEKRFVKAWSQIGNAFSGYDEHLIFESMNEPRHLDSELEWMGGTADERKIVNDLNAAFVKEIRSQGGNNLFRFLMIPDYAASSSYEAINGVVIPNDKRIILSIHAYAPYDLAMNGDGHTDFSASDKAELDSIFKLLDERFISRGVPVVIGEMGITDKNNPADRIAWTEYYVKNARKYGMTCIWWDNGQNGTGEDNFGIIDRSTGKFYNEKIADAFVKNSK